MGKIKHLLFATAICLAISSVSHAGQKQPPGTDSKTIVSAVSFEQPTIAEFPAIIYVTHAGENSLAMHAEVKTGATSKMVTTTAVTPVPLLHSKLVPNIKNNRPPDPVRHRSKTAIHLGRTGSKLLLSRHARDQS
jgi:hypothetical protein